MEKILSLVDFTQTSFLISVASIIFNPTWWNITARYEYKNHFLTKLFNGNKYVACYVLAACIFSLGLLRDKLFDDAIRDQPTLEALDNPFVLYASYLLTAFGTVLVLTSMWKLGVTGTYLGDYFGILMKERVTGFPFNIMENPMYNGSTILFLSHSLQNRSPAGLVLTFLVYIVYYVALQFEGPFTTFIYSQAEKNKKIKIPKKEK
eukprot:TRINITY_DN2316_c0_g1_i4.p1 TRINITY_DN2316_c0_g1~~TRINITY_DN2316_c0_g1_i4.p1  ORF type:complete len:206 (+),score=26.92 TRINITY_DN2316_c0_g1_i4:308-925(+)